MSLPWPSAMCRRSPRSSIARYRILERVIDRSTDREPFWVSPTTRDRIRLSGCSELTRFGDVRLTRVCRGPTNALQAER